MNVLDALEAEVKRQADERTPELLPALLEQIVNRAGLVECERHVKLLGSYVQAQVSLTKFKRCYYGEVPNFGEYTGNSQGVSDSYHFALRRRDEIRAKYRSTPCTCWVPKH